MEQNLQTEHCWSSLLKQSNLKKDKSSHGCSHTPAAPQARLLNNSGMHRQVKQMRVETGIPVCFCQEANSKGQRADFHAAKLPESLLHACTSFQRNLHACPSLQQNPR
eukprot:scaffold57428_cov18-Tisochrysis_lutea.AAC.1